MMLSARHVNPPLKAILRAFMRIDDAAVAEVPLRGPLILATNHINWLDAPVGFSHLHPRPLTAFAKIETWDNFLLRTLFNAWEAIPITRGQVDFTAFKKAEAALEKGKIIAIAPEGTRSRTGKLSQGYPGIVYLALRTGVPILPFVFYGNENFSRDIRRYQRTEMILRAGKPFRLVHHSSNPDRLTRQELTDAIMYEIANLLPEHYRGQYSQVNHTYHRHLEFIDLTS
ncbi:MAG: lysophospholipid acyltransferase family protein [Anaerolineaceae bacterium]